MAERRIWNMIEDVVMDLDEVRVGDWISGIGDVLTEQQRCEIVTICNAFRHHFARACERGCELAGEVERLQAVVDELPKCWRLNEEGRLVQNAPIVPRTIVYYVHPKGNVYPRHVGFNLEEETSHYDYANKLHWIGLTECYSTRAAAEAAKERREAMTKTTADILAEMPQEEADVIRGHLIELDRLRAEVIDLQAVVDELPKTKDGEPVVPGMSVFYPICEGERRGEIVEQWIAADLHVSVCKPGKEPSVYCWYGKKENAEAAAKKGSS